MPHLGLTQITTSRTEAHGGKVVGDLADNSRHKHLGTGEVKLRKPSMITRMPIAITRKTPRSRG